MCLFSLFLFFVQRAVDYLVAASFKCEIHVLLCLYAFKSMQRTIVKLNSIGILTTDHWEILLYFPHIWQLSQDFWMHFKSYLLLKPLHSLSNFNSFPLQSMCYLCKFCTFFSFSVLLRSLICSVWKTILAFSTSTSHFVSGNQ